MQTILEVRLSWNLDSERNDCYIGDRTFLCKDIEGAKEYLQYLNETDYGIHDIDFNHFVEAITTARKSNHSVVVSIGNDTYEAEVIPKTVW